MDEEAAHRPVLLLDTCCVLNLYAAGYIEDILCSAPYRFAIAEAARDEVIYVLHGGEGEDASVPERIDLRPLIDGGLLEVVNPDSDDEMATYVDLGAELDDGEAMTCALAMHRGAGIATDERKTLRILSERAPAVEQHTTATLLKHWAESRQIDEVTLRRVLEDVRSRARFEPGKHDPLQSWWRSKLEAE